MELTLELPPPLDEELASEAAREGLSPADQATLLLHLATVLLEADRTTLFQEAVKAFLSSRSLDANQVASAFQELVRSCVTPHDLGKETDAFQNSLSMDVDLPVSYAPELILRNWRNPPVHRIQAARRVNRKKSALGKYASFAVGSETLAREKREEITLEERPKGGIRSSTRVQWSLT
jgi:hypothetical protein